jgi:hypothetical protein
LSATVIVAQQRDQLGEDGQCAVDATGLESRHVSRHYVFRGGGKRQSWKRWPKLTVVWDTHSHVGLAANVCMGPCQDSPQFSPVMRQAAMRHSIREVLGDKGYDAEHNHRVCREELGIPSTVIPVRRGWGGSRVWPTTSYRRLMKRKNSRDNYGQRWQAESAFSCHKRVLGAALRARLWLMQRAEIALRLLTHNLMMVASI